MCTKVKRAHFKSSINKMFNTTLSLYLDSTAPHVHKSSIDHISLSLPMHEKEKSEKKNRC